MNPLSSRLKIAIQLFILLVVFCSSLGFAAETSPVQASSRPDPVFNRCSVEQKAVLVQALSDAEGLALNSFQVLKLTQESQRTSSTRYQEWFGSYTSANYALVMANYQHIYEALASQEITFTCGCPELLYAYVSPDQPYKIALCASFWKSPLKGTNSQAGTLVHEMSHFTVVAGTLDHVYTQAYCRLNARFASEKAIHNADSYRYYAENDPQLEPQVPAHQLIFDWGMFQR